MSKRSCRCCIDRGFTLIEVILAITLLFMVIAAVFYFYSNLMENQGKIKEKYALLRTAREFVDSIVFSGDRGLALESGGKRETDRFLLRWKIIPGGRTEGGDLLFGHRTHCPIETGACTIL